MTHPRVAVVIPCFNDGMTVLETLESAQAQENAEIVVVDDGSTDESTLRVLDEIRARGVRVVRQENAGLAAARMAGVAASTARYVHPLDADDLLTPDALRRLADALDAEPEAVVAWGDIRTFGAIDLPQHRADLLDPWAICHLNQIPGTSLIRRQALLDAGGWVMKIGYEDWDLWMAFAERGWSGVHIDDVTLLYRIGEGRMLANARHHHEALFAELRQRHPRLFANRGRNWRRSRAPLRMRLLFPLIGSLPVGEHPRHRLRLVAAEPVRTIKVRSQALRRRRS